MEGKWLCDGLGYRPAATAEANAMRPEDGSWKPGIRDFCFFVADKMRVPTKASNFSQGRWAPTEYLQAFYPESAFPETTPDVKTWKGKGACHFFEGRHNGETDDELLRRKRMCCCDPCLKSKFSACESNGIDRGLWCGYREINRMTETAVKEMVTLYSEAVFDRLRKRKLFKTPSKVKPQMNVVAVRVHKKDKRNGTGEPYHLGKVAGPVRQLKEGGNYEGNYYEKGFFVFGMVWYHYRGTKDEQGKEGEQATGDRTYTLGTGTVDHCTMQLNGLNFAQTRAEMVDLAKQTTK